MNENLPSSKILSAVALAGVFIFTDSAHATNDFARSLALLAPTAQTPSSESVLSGTLVEQNGLTAISSIDLKWDAPSGTGALNEANVTPDGQVSSRDANLECHGDGTVIVRGTMTDFDGHSVNYSEILRPTPNGFVARGATSGVVGEITNYETTVALISCNELRRTTVTSKPDGTTSTRVEKIIAPAP